MIRTIEVLFVILILAGAFLTVSYFTVLPPPRAGFTHKPQTTLIHNLADA